MSKQSITIIGMGPRGVSVLERLAHYLDDQTPRQALVVNVIDPGECGQGTHSANQPMHLLTNTLANQVTLFPPHSRAVPGGGWSFGEWARQCGYRMFGDTCQLTQDQSGEEIGDQHYLPRRLLGLYFTWAFDRIAASLKGRIDLRHFRMRAVGIQRQGDDRYHVRLQSGFVVLSDFLFLTTGHGTRHPDHIDKKFEAFVSEHAKDNPNLGFYRHAYPTHLLERISPDATVAVQGFGLTAHDVVAQLTSGRGGRFETQGGQRVYIRSGREPKIVMYSRKSLPFSARPKNQKSVSGRYAARFFTMDAIEALRQQAVRLRGSAQIDFVNEVLPLVKRDMAFARKQAQTGAGAVEDGWLATAADIAAVDDILDPLRNQSFQDFAQFQAFFHAFLENDLVEVDKGNVLGPVKAATDVLRDLRENFRMAAEFRGFTPRSHKMFTEVFVGTLNRIVFGPPRHRNEELLALLDAGVVSLGGGPDATTDIDKNTATFRIQTRFGTEVTSLSADVLVLSRIDVFSPADDSSPLMQDLMERGLVRPFVNHGYHPGGIDIDEENRVVDAGGASTPDFWAIGYLVEGPHYYTQELPRPGRYSRLTGDADLCVKGLFSRLSMIQDTSSAATVGLHFEDVGQ